MLATEPIKGLEERIAELYSKNIIDDITYSVFIDECERIKKELKYFEIQERRYRKPSGEKIPEERVESLVKDFSILDIIIECIEDNKIDTSRKEFILELIMKLEEFNKISILIINEGVNFSPTCFPLSQGKDLVFIVLIPKSPDYLSDNLVGLLAHEACHSHNIIKSFTESTFSYERRKIGEMLADIMAYAMIEFAFSYSINYYVQKILDFGNPKRKSNHPSWNARVKLLGRVTNVLWDSDDLKERNNSFLQSSIGSFSNQELSEENIINKGYKEVNNLYGTLANLKLDEYMLKNIKDLQINDIKGQVQTLSIIQRVVLEC